MTFDDSVTVISKSIQDLRIAPGDTPITADEAIKVALLFDSNQGRPITKSNEKEVYTRIQNGKPVFYVINRTEGGFVIVGASRKYYPILAYSEKGRFDENYINSGLEIWAIQQENNIRWLDENVTDEQLKMFNAAWKPYENCQSVMGSITKSGNIIAVRDSLITAWEAQGYSWTSLSECPDGLPYSTYTNWCSSAQSIANDEYDYLENSIIFYKTEVNSHSSAFANVLSIWDQNWPYNQNIQYYYPNGNRAYAGCATIALGQIMRYHGCPSTYNWSAMPYDCYDYNGTVASFINDLFEDFIMLLNVELFGHSTAKPIGTLASIIENNYNYDVTYGGHNIFNVMSSLTSGNPVYMSGLTPGSTLGHAWVCDGYNRSIYVKTFTLMIISQVTPPLHYEFLADYTGDAGSVTYFSMNWGRGGLDNGMFLDNTFYPGADYSSSRQDMFLEPLN